MSLSHSRGVDGKKAYSLFTPCTVQVCLSLGASTVQKVHSLSLSMYSDRIPIVGGQELRAA